MAKKQQTNWYYVLVLTNDGPVFVTELGDHHYAYWNRTECPYEFSRSMANEIALGLSANGYVAYAINTKYELTSQPYYYRKGHFEWVWDKNVKGESVC